MYFLIYKTTNLVNGKFYIGKHQTTDLNDGYVGSGKLLKRAINKYGIENFSTETLEIYDTEEKMNLAEKILVVPDREISYNLCAGGHGGFGYINYNKLYLTESYKIATQKNRKLGLVKIKVLLHNTEWKNSRNLSIKASMKEKYKTEVHHWIDKCHTTKTKSIMSEKAKSRTKEKNSQFGTCWITDGIVNKKIKNDDLDLWTSQGYCKGRTL
jgi:hypothetical protein